ncbi:MAG: metal-dependent hydrolase, partial [Candidatus Helarchaeota archaeon]|nr:metal-dependent hydrolase [Candidatus Helarchaeota archaeon]
MTSFFTHMFVGILFAELILRYKLKDASERAENRVKYWWVGLFSGLLPDLDVIPAYILGLHPYALHHIITHTFLAIGVVALFTFYIYRDNPLTLPFFAGYSMHLVVDFLDNSISPLGPFDPITEWGLLAGWGPIPGGSWASEFWLPPWGPLLYGDH